MMSQKTESKEDYSVGNSNSGQLLRDIEEISKALYLHKSPPNVLLSPSDGRSKSAGKTRLSDSNPRFVREDLLHKDKKSSSVWNWKRPLKALSHMGNRKFSCCFYLHVHSVEGLPVSFNNLSVCVHWKRKGEVLQTRSSKVVEGVAEFDETLMHRCSVYGSRNGANHSVKYEEKLSLIYVSLSGAPGLDIGNHWVDLTRLLPLTFEELEGGKSYGKWTTSFNLSGKARGANLNVSLGFSVMQHKLVSVRDNPNVPELTNTRPRGSSSFDGGATMLRRVGSVPCNVTPRPAFSSQSLDLKICREALLNGGLELSKSSNFLCQTFDETRLSSVTESDCEHVPPLGPKTDIDFPFAKGIEECEDDDTEFTIVEVGTEMSEKEELQSDQVPGHANNESAVEIIYLDEIINDYDMDLEEKTMVIPKEVHDSYVDQVVVDDSKHEQDSICIKGLAMGEVESATHIQLISESVDLDHPFSSGEFLEERNHKELRSTYKASKTGKKSLSLDDVTESVSSDFLSILGMDCSMSSDSDAESPRERLLREFENEALGSGNLFFGFDWKEEQPEIGSCVSPGSDSGDCYENSDLLLIIEAAEEEHKKESELLRRRKAKILEGLETEALMREWGLNEKDFRNSPCTFSGGFGSPIELPLEEPLLPPLGEGFGSYVRLKGGGILQSMNPSLFRNAKNGGNLVIQISNPVVLPAIMGYDVIEIMQHLALVGDTLHEWVNKLMPLEDITGKTIQQVTWEAAAAAPNIVGSERFEQILYGGRQDEGCPSSWSCNNLSSAELGGSDMGSDYVSLEYLAPLAMKKIEAFSLEGLRIQSRMSGGEAPSIIYPESGGLQLCGFGDHVDDAKGLLALSLSLDEWLRLDATIINDEDHSRDQMLKILAAHHAKYTDLIDGNLTQDTNCSDLSGRKCGLLGDNLTIALMVQLRDPFRNYEPVGVPMLALIQVERALANLKPEVSSVPLNDSKENVLDEPVFEEYGDKIKGETNEGDEGWNPQFKIIDVHLSGVDTTPGKRLLWGTTTQLQSGSRWLLGTGMGKTTSFPLSNSKALVRSSTLVSAKKHRDFLWSISSHFQGTGYTWKDSIAPHVRNPNVIFPNESIKPHVNM
ncbi:protein PLASTID MOVEMENT IMPAIRED 1-RELATED 1-like isoform X2 [Malus sylvestris]|nr:protein PLASTID MOVEMENT IMPAIRED 1-RELATED 1-like isoform X2 [Malus sylvestris]